MSNDNSNYPKPEGNTPLDLGPIEERQLTLYRPALSFFPTSPTKDAVFSNAAPDIAALVAEVKRLRSKYEGPFPRFDDAKVGEVFGLSFLVKGEWEPMYIPGEDES